MRHLLCEWPLYELRILTFANCHPIASYHVILDASQRGLPSSLTAFVFVDAVVAFVSLAVPVPKEGIYQESANQMTDVVSVSFPNCSPRTWLLIVPRNKLF